MNNTVYRLIRTSKEAQPEHAALWRDHAAIAYCLNPANANGQQWFTAAAILQCIQTHWERFPSYTATLPNVCASLTALQRAGFVEAIDVQTALNVVQESGRLLDQVQNNASWEALALLAEALDWPTEDPFAEMLWRKSNHDRITVADDGMRLCGYVPFAGYPLELLADDDIRITVNADEVKGGYYSYCYDFNATELPQHRRRRAYRLARARIEEDFDPDDLATYSIGKRGIGYVVDTTPLSECTCGRAP